MVAGAAAVLVVLGVGIGLAARRLVGDGGSAAVSAAPPAATGPALAARTARPVEAAPTGPEPAPKPTPEQAEAPREPAAEAQAQADPGDAAASDTVQDLIAVLARRSPAATAAESLDELLVAWGQTPLEVELLSVEQVLTALRAEGLRAEPVSVGSLDAALVWDLPMLLELRALDGLPRAVALLGVEDGEVRVGGLADDARRVPREDLARHLGGRGWVVWRDLGDLPPIVRPGSDREAVDWLQGALGVLGLWSGPASGVYDAETIAGVRAFQAREGLTVDGTVGARTKARLYARLPTYEMPRLGAVRLAEGAR
jgi:murein L,D-transpeptidase YcbB/YkuD